MPAYFIGVKKLEPLEAELESWIDTPFRHRTGVKGLGCDCIHFIAGVLKTFNLVQTERKGFIPEYGFDWNLHKTRELLLEGIKKEVNCIEVPVTWLANGDLVLFKFGKASAHVAFYLKEYFYHSITDIGVVKSQIGSGEWKQRITHVLRIME
jgi:NlpC/P60 family putative phage cell wall peptidase